MIDSTHWALSSAVAIASLVMLASCNLHYDLDSVEAPASNEFDAARDTDASDAIAADADDSDTADAPDETGDGEDAGPTSPFDTTCAEAPGEARTCLGELGELEGDCDPLVCEGCESGQTCMLGLRFDGGQPDAFVSSCVGDQDVGELGPGESCTSAGDCGPRTLCVNWERPDPRGRVCSRLCDLRSGLGCPEGYLCTNPLEGTLAGLGLCSRSCDPMQTDSCPDDLVCAHDPNFPDATCKRDFRCLQNGGFADKAPGDACDPSALHEDGCPPELICTLDGTCETPCREDGDCPDGQQCPADVRGLNTCQ